VDEAKVWSTARLADGDGRSTGLSVNGFALDCDVPLDPGPEPTGPTPLGLLAASLSACTAMSVRTFLHRWRVEPGEVQVHVAFVPGSPPVMHREVVVAGEVGPDLREQLAHAVDGTPVTVLLRDSITIRTVLTTGTPNGR
jgi:putative redox protein